MTTSRGSCSQVTLVTSSELYREFRLSDIPRIRETAKDLAMVPLKSWKYREPLPSGHMYSVDISKISLNSLYSTLERIEKMVMNTEAGMEYKINSLFQDQSVKNSSPWSTRPGTLRVFSQTLASFYDGKNWRKIDVR
jgi:hypothetical protein